jgi:hypothetical protein
MFGTAPGRGDCPSAAASRGGHTIPAKRARVREKPKKKGICFTLKLHLQKKQYYIIVIGTSL